MKSIFILHAGAFSREIITLLQFLGYTNIKPYSSSNRCNTNLSNKSIHLCLARGDSKGREQDYLSLAAKYCFPQIIHPNSQLLNEHTISLGKGTILCAGSILTTDISIGDFNLINLHCSIGHDVKTDNFCSLMPGVRLSGGVKLGRGVYLGTNALVLPNINIGDYATIGAGSVITKDVPPYSTVVGVPGKVIKRNNSDLKAIRP